MKLQWGKLEVKFCNMPNPRLIKKAMQWMNPECPEVRETKSQEPLDLNIPANINPGDYLQIPGANQVISKFELPGYNKLNWKDTHFKLNENGLYMPIPKIFMSHFTNVIDAYKNKKPLFDAKGNDIHRKEVEDIYKHLTTDHIAVYKNQGGNQAGAWTWLDALFEEENREWFIKYNHRVVNGNLSFKKEKLENCLREDCFVDLEFNRQGLALKKSNKQEYSQGENLYFSRPRNGFVAGFNADSYWAWLYCGRDPEDSDSSLGVFACAEGATLKN